MEIPAAYAAFFVVAIFFIAFDISFTNYKPITEYVIEYLSSKIKEVMSMLIR